MSEENNVVSTNPEGVATPVEGATANQVEETPEEDGSSEGGEGQAVAA